MKHTPSTNKREWPVIKNHEVILEILDNVVKTHVNDKYAFNNDPTIRDLLRLMGAPYTVNTSTDRVEIDRKHLAKALAKQKGETYEEADS